MNSCGRSVVPGGNASAGSGFESASIGARVVHTAVLAKSRSSKFTFGSWSNIFKTAENAAVSSNFNASIRSLQPRRLDELAERISACFARSEEDELLHFLPAGIVGRYSEGYAVHYLVRKN